MTAKSAITKALASNARMKSLFIVRRLDGLCAEIDANHTKLLLIKRVLTARTSVRNAKILEFAYNAIKKSDFRMANAWTSARWVSNITNK